MKDIYIFRTVITDEMGNKQIVGVSFKYGTEDEARETANALCTEKESVNYHIADDIEIQAGKLAGAIA